MLDPLLDAPLVELQSQVEQALDELDERHDHRANRGQEDRIIKHVVLQSREVRRYRAEGVCVGHLCLPI